MSDRPSPLKRKLVDRKLTIEGEKYLLFQGYHPNLPRFRQRPELCRWLLANDGVATHNERVSGMVQIERQDELRIAGWDETGRAATVWRAWRRSSALTRPCISCSNGSPSTAGIRRTAPRAITMTPGAMRASRTWNARQRLRTFRLS